MRPKKYVKMLEKFNEISKWMQSVNRSLTQNKAKVTEAKSSEKVGGKAGNGQTPGGII